HGNEFAGGDDSYERDFLGDDAHYTEYTHSRTPSGAWSYTVGSAAWDAYDTVTNGAGFAGFQPWSGSSASWNAKTLVYRLFWHTAELADNFDSDDVNGEGATHFIRVSPFVGSHDLAEADLRTV